MLRRMLLFVLISFAFADEPERIILNLTDSPENSIAVTWRTRDKQMTGLVNYAEATDWTEFKAQTISQKALTTEFITDENDTVWHHSAVMQGLKPSTQYIYRVGSESSWSEWNQFKTADSAPLKFVFLGDPQNGLKEHCSRLFRSACKTASDADFWLFSGDLVSEPEDWQYRDFFYAAGFIFRTLPSVMTPGNHDRSFEFKDGEIVLDEDGDKERLERVAEEWRMHFTLPENGPDEYKETSYHFDYKGVRFIMIDSNDEEKLHEQTEWIESLLADNPNKWTIISFHYPFYSAGRNRDNDDTRNAFQPLFDKYYVDLVLTGHDHAYARSYKIVNGNKVGWEDKGTVYVVSVAGPKMYSVNSNYDHLMAKTGGNVQLFQVITVKDSVLEYTSYTVTGTEYDRFVLNK